MTRRVSRPMVLGCVAAAVVATSCVRPTVRAPKAPEEFERYLTLYDHLLALHCARPVESRPGVPLLLYATGDGGWRGKDRDAYRRMIYWGYPVAGFSAPDYLKHLGFVSGTTTPARLARDYRELIEFARTALRLPPATRAVLVGVSRGAGLAVVAASRSELHDDLAGVLAVALTKEEEYVRHYRVRRGTSPSDMPKRELVEFQTYASLHRLTTLPLAVIQSTADGYLSAADARQLFGPDTERRRFFAIEARDHSFGGAREALYGQMEASLAWICHFSPSPEAK